MAAPATIGSGGCNHRQSRLQPHAMPTMPAMPRHVGGRTGEHGWQLDAVAGVEEAGGEGDADEVVAEGPHEVEPDAAHHHAREVEGRRHVGE
jgi:hypothetical protein